MADLLLPLCCVVCTRILNPGEAGIVCGHCWSRVRGLPGPRCQRCGHPLGRWACRWCPNLPAFVRSARSYCWMGAGTGEDIVHALKYEGWPRIADAMAVRMLRMQWPQDVVEERALVVPVPLSPARLRERGYNQSSLLAAPIARAWGAEMRDDVVVRDTATRSQTRLTPGERLSNVAGAFTVPVKAAHGLSGEHVILVDDVLTTGATLRACASALLAAGARTISYMTFGRAPASGDRLTT